MLDSLNEFENVPYYSLMWKILRIGIFFKCLEFTKETVLVFFFSETKFLTSKVKEEKIYFISHVPVPSQIAPKHVA